MSAANEKAMAAQLHKWGIDHSTGTPILVYENCSVIESEQAEYVLDLLRQASVASTDALVILNAIDLLREAEGNTVTFVCDNPDFNGLPNARIVCNGNWTGWEDRVFSADTVMAALQMAVAEQMKEG